MFLPEPYFQDYVFRLKATLNLRSGTFQYHLPWTLQLHFFQIKPTCFLEPCRAGGGSHSFHVSQLLICFICLNRYLKALGVVVSRTWHPLALPREYFQTLVPPQSTIPTSSASSLSLSILGEGIGCEQSLYLCCSLPI